MTANERQNRRAAHRAELRQARATRKRQQRLRSWLRRVALPITAPRVFALISVILIPLAAIYVTAADSDLVLLNPAKVKPSRNAVGTIESPPTLVKDDQGRVVAASSLFRVDLDFQNRGLKPGYVDRVDIRTYPATTDSQLIVHHVERSVLRWHQTKRLHFEFVGLTKGPGHHVYHAVFIDNDGREIEQVQIEWSNQPQSY